MPSAPAPDHRFAGCFAVPGRGRVDLHKTNNKLFGRHLGGTHLLRTHFHPIRMTNCGATPLGPNRAVNTTQGRIACIVKIQIIIGPTLTPGPQPFLQRGLHGDCGGGEITIRRPNRRGGGGGRSGGSHLSSCSVRRERGPGRCKPQTLQRFSAQAQFIEPRAHGRAGRARRAPCRGRSQFPYDRFAQLLRPVTGDHAFARTHAVAQMFAPRLGACHRVALGQAGDGLLDPGHGFARILDDPVAQRMHDAQVVLRQAMTAQGGFAKKRCAPGQVGRATGAVHQHRTQIALRARVPSVGRDPIEAAGQSIITSNRGITGLKAARELENSLGLSARRRKFGDGGDDIKVAGTQYARGHRPNRRLSERKRG